MSFQTGNSDRNDFISSGFFVFLFLVIVPMVKFLREHLEKSGCVVGDKFIRAARCNKQISGGYVRGEGVFIIYSIVFGLS